MRAHWHSLTIYIILYLSNLSTTYISIWGPHEVMIRFELNNVLHHFHCSPSGAQPRRFGGSILQPPWRRWGYIRRWMRTRSSPHSSCLDLESYMSDGKWVWHQASGTKWNMNGVWYPKDMYFVILYSCLIPPIMCVILCIVSSWFSLGFWDFSSPYGSDSFKPLAMRTWTETCA